MNSWEIKSESWAYEVEPTWNEDHVWQKVREILNHLPKDGLKEIIASRIQNGIAYEESFFWLTQEEMQQPYSPFEEDSDSNQDVLDKAIKDRIFWEEIEIKYDRGVTSSNLTDNHLRFIIQELQEYLVFFPEKSEKLS